MKISHVVLIAIIVVLVGQVMGEWDIMPSIHRGAQALVKVTAKMVEN